MTTPSPEDSTPSPKPLPPPSAPDGPHESPEAASSDSAPASQSQEEFHKYVTSQLKGKYRRRPEDVRAPGVADMWKAVLALSFPLAVLLGALFFSPYRSSAPQRYPVLEFKFNDADHRQVGEELREWRNQQEEDRRRSAERKPGESDEEYELRLKASMLSSFRPTSPSPRR